MGMVGCFSLSCDSQKPFTSGLYLLRKISSSSAGLLASWRPSKSQIVILILVNPVSRRCLERQHRRTFTIAWQLHNELIPDHPLRSWRKIAISLTDLRGSHSGPVSSVAE